MTEPGPEPSPAVRAPTPSHAVPEAPAPSYVVPEAPAPSHAVPEAPLMQMSRWGRRATIVYLIACVLALLAMLIETLLGHPGTGSMFAAILAVPWSMLVAGFAPPLPHDWPMAAGLAVRMVPLALFMLLNAAILGGIAARSERDLQGAGQRRG